MTKTDQNFILNLNRETIERDDFEKSVGIFYARLLADQEPLGEKNLKRFFIRTYGTYTKVRRG